MRRRQFLKDSSSLCGGLSLPVILANRANAGAERRETSVIFVTLGGGAAQHETYDPKPDAPVEYRGEFRAISTSVPGVAFCELLPRQAQLAEFGRTPKVNAKAGRDHWPAVASVMLAGGDYRMGQVIGATDERGASVASAPYPPQSVLAMVYRHLGIDPGRTFPDFTGRPRAILEQRAVIRELTS